MTEEALKNNKSKKDKMNKEIQAYMWSLIEFGAKGLPGPFSKRLHETVGRHSNQKEHQYKEDQRERRDKCFSTGWRSKKGAYNDRSLYKTFTK